MHVGLFLLEGRRRSALGADYSFIRKSGLGKTINVRKELTSGVNSLKLTPVDIAYCVKRRYLTRENKTEISMPRPTDPTVLIYSPGGLFPYTSWEEHVRTFKYFRVHGFNHFRRATGLNDVTSVENDSIVQQAKQIVKKQWGRYLPPSNVNKDEIDRLGTSQVRRARKHLAVSFQSACLSIVALELALSHAGSAIDIYPSKDDLPRIAICPALFQVDNYDQSFYEANILGNPANHVGLAAATLQRVSLSDNPKQNVFLDMAEGKLVTEWLAARFVKFWSATSTSVAGVSVCKPRNGNKYRKVSELEVQAFPM